MTGTESLISRLRTWSADPRQIAVSELHGVERGIAVVMRNVYWGRSHGWADLLEEHDLNLVARVPRDLRKLIWLINERVETGEARPVLLFGAQRSGTNMVTHGLAMSPEVAVYNEGDRRAFDNYRLESNDVISGLVRRSRRRFVLFKPLLDSHRALELLDDVEWPNPARALWVYRDVRARARSAVAKFGDSNLRILRRRAEDPGFSHWQLGDRGGLSPASRAILDSFDPFDLSPIDGAALFWLIRNRVYFDLGLTGRDDVCLISYERFLTEPETTMHRVCDFLGFPYRDSLIAHITPRPAPVTTSTDIAPEILELCDQLMTRLQEAEGRQAVSSVGEGHP